MLWTGIGMLAACGIHAIYGIVDGVFAVRRFNRRSPARAFAFAPLVGKSPEGATRLGLALSGTF